MYIYWLSDLFIVIDTGPSLTLVAKLCIPLIGKMLIKTIDYLAVLNIDFLEWWKQPTTTNIIVSYIFIALQWIYDNSIHVCWDKVMKYTLDGFFIYLVSRILYNFICIYNFSLIYLLLTCTCTYSVYIKFRSSKTAFVTLIAKTAEMGSSIILSDNLHRIEDYHDYCIKNKESWITYIIKLVIGYNKSTDTDGELMASKVSNFIGVNSDECRYLYENSIIKKVSSVVELSKSVYTKITGSVTNEKEITE
jgi:hypothetical protein